MSYGVRFDRFTAGLDDLTRKQQASTEAVLRVLKRTGRFSVFEATENQTIANTMTRLCHSALIETDHSCGYPWTNVKLTASGEALIAGKETPHSCAPDRG
jgi:hypothetical protein